LLFRPSWVKRKEEGGGRREEKKEKQQKDPISKITRGKKG
jgi:hypothetical protein